MFNENQEKLASLGNGSFLIDCVKKTTSFMVSSTVHVDKWQVSPRTRNDERPCEPVVVAVQIFVSILSDRDT